LEDTTLSTNAILPAGIPYKSVGYGRPALLFIHGFMDAAAVWEPVIGALPADLQKITIDLPGMGALSSYTGEVSLTSYAAAVGRLIEQIGKPVVIVAQSMGAQIAELAAVASPGLVRGLVLLAPIPLRGLNAPAEAIRRFKQLGGQPGLQRQARRNLSHALSAENEALLGAAGDLVDPSVVATLVDVWNSGDPAGDEPSAFLAPVLVIGGASDKLVSGEMVSGVTRRFAKGHEATIASAGHWPHVEQPSRVAALIDTYSKDLNWPLPEDKQASDWKGAFSQQSAAAFGETFAEDVVLEASVLLGPARGREGVKRIMEAASKIYEFLEFTDQAVDGPRQYLQWRARAFGGIEIDGVTIITRNSSGAIARIAIHKRPLSAVLLFSAALGRSLRGNADADNFLSADDLPQNLRGRLIDTLHDGALPAPEQVGKNLRTPWRLETG
jgi:pimeloyl-ACP methyl ester carboxylesterase